MKLGNIFSKIGKFIWNVVQVLIIVYVMFITFCILFRNKFGYTQFDNITLVSIGEEEVEYIKDAKEGDLLLVKESKFIKEGDLIYYYYPFNEQYIIKSGYVKSMTEGETTSLYVLDDVHNSNVASTRVLGKEFTAYSKWGKVLDILESRFGFLFLVLLPIMVVFIYQIYEFIIVLKYEKVEEDETPKKKKVSNDVSKKKIEQKNNDDDIEIL